MCPALPVGEGTSCGVASAPAGSPRLSYYPALTSEWSAVHLGSHEPQVHAFLHACPACFALPAVGCALPSLCAGPVWGPQRDRHPVATAQRCACTSCSCVAVLRLQVSGLVELVELSSRDSWGSWSPRNLELVELLPAVGCALLIVRMCIAPCSGHTEARGARSLVICGM